MVVKNTDVVKQSIIEPNHTIPVLTHHQGFALIGYRDQIQPQSFVLYISIYFYPLWYKKPKSNRNFSWMNLYFSSYWYQSCFFYIHKGLSWLIYHQKISRSPSYTHTSCDCYISLIYFIFFLFLPCQFTKSSWTQTLVESAFIDANFNCFLEKIILFWSIIS